LRVDEQLTHLKGRAKEAKEHKFMCFIDWTLRWSSILQGTYFVLVEPMPDKHTKAFVLIVTTMFA